MKALFLIRALNIGGAQRQLVALANGLSKNGHTVLVTVYYPFGDLGHLLSKEIHLFSINKRNRWDVFLSFMRLLTIIGCHRPDVLLSYHVTPNLLTVPIKLIFPKLRIIWGKRSSKIDWSDLNWISRITYWAEAQLSRFADLIIVNSSAGLEHAIKNGFPRRKMRLIFNGIDTECFVQDLQSGLKVRNEWGISGDQVLIGAVGRLDPLKNIEIFLEAAKLVGHCYPNARFVCVGDGPGQYQNKLIALANSLGLRNLLVWAGDREDMPAVYNAIDILVSSSISEGFSNVIGEAMACGVPCVVTRVGDSSNLIGCQGIVVPPRNPIELANGIKKMIHRLDSTSPNSIRKRIVENFALQKMIQESERIIFGGIAN